MHISKALKKVIKLTNSTQAAVAAHMSDTERTYTQKNVAAWLGNGNPSINTILKMAEAMNYEVVLQPKKRGRRAEGQIVIGEDDDE